MLCGLAGVLGFGWAAQDLQLVREVSADLNSQSSRYAAIAAGWLLMFVIGLLDDRLELKPGAKFLGQLIVSLGIAFAGIRLGIFAEHPFLQISITVIWLLAVTNAFNFIDNMNGLCAGLCVVSAISIAVLAAKNQLPATAAIASALAGAACGFLPFNYPRASSFLGDSGSHLIGFALATLAIVPALWSGAPVPLANALGPALLLAIPLVDLTWVVCYRTWIRKPVYVGDNNHLSHRLVQIGLPRPAAVALLWAAAAIICVIALALH